MLAQHHTTQSDYRVTIGAHHPLGPCLHGAEVRLEQFRKVLMPPLHDGIWHAVRGRKQLGLLMDTGACGGLMGADTFGEILEHVLKPNGIDCERRESHGLFSGIEGNSTRAICNVKFDFPLTGFETGTFEGDVVGGNSTLIPPLVPNPKLIQNRNGILAGYFDNGA